MKNISFLTSGWIALPLAAALSHPGTAAIQRATLSNNEGYIVVESLSDQVFHVEMGAGAAPSADLYASPMILKRDYSGASTYSRQGDTIRTAQSEATVDASKLCISVRERAKQILLTVLCPVSLNQPWKGLTITKEQSRAVYGLGQQFKQLGSSDGNWLVHRIRDSGPYGNHFEGFGPAGMVGNVQIPVLYALGPANYALLLDNVYKQTWDFSGETWKVNMFGDQIRFYVITGPDLPDLRRKYMELVGTPPVPPKKAFGLWVSEFGYKNWDQIETLRTSLRNDRFPVEGFVLDLFWFGGIKANDDNSAMGNLDWDRGAFPGPEQHIAALRADHVGLMAIEESYISKNTSTYSNLNTAGQFLAYAPSSPQCNRANYTPVMLSEWFGNAGMVDWTNAEAGAWVQNHRRLPNLISKGVTGHWTDLGEPEKYNDAACYQGVETTSAGVKNHHADVHNLYAFLWNKSIYDGYFHARQQVDARPFILTRSGAAGVHRFGSGAWSGDIGASLDLLATHANAQMHMSFSGIDYYGADIGGFRREAMPCNQKPPGNLQYQNELYTQWFANGAWFDVPVRPHTDNSFQKDTKYATAPNLVGVKDSNRENLRQRYELVPYYYSLAYRAHLYGEPVVPPLVFYYENDRTVQDIGHEKLIGRDLLVAIVARHGEHARNVYLPAGRWVDYHTNESINSSGKWVNDYPEYLNGTFRLPVFARAGAILPMMYVDDQTKDVFGHRLDGSTRDELIVKVYADESASKFTLYEDDGETLRYDPISERPKYTYRTTELSQLQQGNTVNVTVDSAQGGYNGAPGSRDNVVRLVVRDAQGVSVTLSGQALQRFDSHAAFEAAASGWYNAERNVIVAKSGPRNVTAKKVFQFALQPITAVASIYFACANGFTKPGEDVYVVGNTAALGNGNINNAVKLNPSVYYEYIYNPPPPACGPGPSTPTWTGLVSGLPAGATLEWMCVKKLNSGEWEYQRDKNRVTLTAAGFAGTSYGRF